MAHRIKPIQKTKLDRILPWAIIIASALGTLDAIYLLVLKYTQSEILCVGNHGCITVNNSVYSEIRGIPVSVLGIVAYLTIIGITLLEPRLKIAGELGPLAVFGVSLGGTVFSAYLTWLEFAVIHAVCPFCVTSAVLITLVFILALVRLIKQTTS